jgi:hypothetical protein
MQPGGRAQTNANFVHTARTRYGLIPAKPAATGHYECDTISLAADPIFERPENPKPCQPGAMPSRQSSSSIPRQERTSPASDCL